MFTYIPTLFLIKDKTVEFVYFKQLHWLTQLRSGGIWGSKWLSYFAPEDTVTPAYAAPLLLGSRDKNMRNILDSYFPFPDLLPIIPNIWMILVFWNMSQCFAFLVKWQRPVLFQPFATVYSQILLWVTCGFPRQKRLREGWNCKNLKKLRWRT